MAASFYYSSDINISQAIFGWNTMSKVKSRVPRGFTRFYALYLIKERPMTGKEIMEEAEKRSEGEWSPSPGLIYPLLGRLLRDELIEEIENGKFVITSEGLNALDQYSRLQSQIERQIKLVRKLGLSVFTAGKMFAEESMDRILNVTEMMKDRMSEGSRELQIKFYESYRAFLERELEKLKEQEYGLKNSDKV
jgi:DNA-binding PadR family transcriptional regulator